MSLSSWSVPLFLFVSDSNRDVALLPQAPAVSLGPDYIKLFREPVAFAHASATSQHPLVTLRAYWSAERRDIQTTTQSIQEVNENGGNYTALQTVGLVAVALTAGTSANQFVPLRLAYDSVRQDAASAPVNGADLNRALAHAAYSTGRAIAFVRKSDCQACNVSMSEAFPSAGGADCAFPCAGPDLQCETTTYRLGQIHSSSAAAFVGAMASAGGVLKSFGQAHVEGGLNLHMSLNYFCCYDASELSTIRAVLERVQWPTLNVSFDRPAWRLNGHGTGTPTIANTDHMSMIVMLDSASQTRMLAFAESIEARIRSAGIDVHVPRREQEPFHATLAVVSGTAYPAVAALEAVNAAVPPGSWTASHGPITLPPPQIF